jgi:hypothetical protein
MEKAIGMTEELVTPPDNEQVICTLYEGDYHFGLAALINSIVRGGFRGLFWVGYRGELPPWTAQLQRRTDGLYQVGEALLGFELINRSGHFTQFKPEFMSTIIDRRIVRKYLWYFDPDITVRCEWQFFERWIRFGVCLCQEITMGMMPSNHPLRCEWMEIFRNEGWGEVVSQQERYYNGGFVGLDLQHRAFVETWKAAMRVAASAGVNENHLQHGTRAEVFFSTDQDALNVATMYAKAPLTAIGPEGMGWIPGGFTMYHTVGGKKPWRKKFIRSALSGNPPWNGDKHFLECAQGPIQPFSQAKLKKMRLAARLASLVGRFYAQQ